MEGVELAVAEISAGVNRSVVKHGDWSDYSVGRMIWVIGLEFWEVLWAVLRRDIHGPHGVVNELRDLAVTCIKGMTRLGRFDLRQQLASGVVIGKFYIYRLQRDNLIWIGIEGGEGMAFPEAAFMAAVADCENLESAVCEFFWENF